MLNATQLVSDARAALLARVCLRNGGRLSKRKRERCFAELTDGQVGAGEAAVAESDMASTASEMDDE